MANLQRFAQNWSFLGSISHLCGKPFSKSEANNTDPYENSDNEEKYYAEFLLFAGAFTSVRQRTEQLSQVHLGWVMAFQSLE
ncbi:hypothetical protein NQZ68_040279 [Dissostichus eleginoides]|nr:hypothetical protein NQZ68_040279 [Dissostichus eleginoides]